MIRYSPDSGITVGSNTRDQPYPCRDRVLYSVSRYCPPLLYSLVVQLYVRYAAHLTNPTYVGVSGRLHSGLCGLAAVIWVTALVDGTWSLSVLGLCSPVFLIKNYTTQRLSSVYTSTLSWRRDATEHD